jgi:hypothetical protein
MATKTIKSELLPYPPDADVRNAHHVVRGILDALDASGEVTGWMGDWMAEEDEDGTAEASGFRLNFVNVWADESEEDSLQYEIIVQRRSS